jgi:hypothetical protein
MSGKNTIIFYFVQIIYFTTAQLRYRPRFLNLNFFISFSHIKKNFKINLYICNIQDIEEQLE